MNLKRPLKSIRESNLITKLLLRGVIRMLVGRGFVKKNNLGFEGAEEALENLYDLGIIKFTVEQIHVSEQQDQMYFSGSVMLYSKKTDSYNTIEKLDLEV